MASERQRAIGREVDERFPRGDLAQNELRMIYNIYRQMGVPQPEAEQRAVADIRKQHPDFTPVRRPDLAA